MMYDVLARPLAFNEYSSSKLIYGCSVSSKTITICENCSEGHPFGLLGHFCQCLFTYWLHVHLKELLKTHINESIANTTMRCPHMRNSTMSFAPPPRFPTSSRMGEGAQVLVDSPFIEIQKGKRKGRAKGRCHGIEKSLSRIVFI